METHRDSILDAMTACEPRGAERRRSRRSSCNGFAEVIVSETGFLFRGEIQDLSETGCLIGTRARLQLKPSGEVELRFTLRNTGFRLDGRIANVRPGLGIGVEFAPIDSEELRAKLHGLCEELNNGLFDTNSFL